MANCFRLFLFFIVLLAVSPLSASAQSESTSGNDWLLLQMSGVLREGSGIDPVIRRLHAVFYKNDIDGGGVSARDYELAQQMKEAEKRSGMLKHWGTFDLDNDGKVTRAEIEIYYGRQARQPITGPEHIQIVPTDEQVALILEKFTKKELAWDLDGDGIITSAEVQKIAADEAEQGRRHDRSEQFDRIPLSLDLNHDDSVTLEELEAAIRLTFGFLDRDGNGKMDVGDMEILHERVKELRVKQREREVEARAMQKAEKCGFPPPGQNSRVIVIGAYEGKGLSSVSIGGEDKEVTVTDVIVEKGSEPLYVVLTSYDANIWRFFGDVGRIERVVASSSQAGAEGRPRVGVTGVAREKVAIAEQYGCVVYFDKMDEEKADLALKGIRLAIGREPDKITAIYGAASVSIPSCVHDSKRVMPGRRKVPTEGPAAGLWRMAQQYNPAGIIDINPESVVASLPARSFEILPQQAGLAQLVEQGALEVFQNTQAYSVSSKGMEKVFLPNQLLILKKMRYPAGLFGGHSVTFILPPGVPAPDGTSGHSRVIRGEKALKMLGKEGHQIPEHEMPME